MSMKPQFGPRAILYFVASILVLGISVNQGVLVPAAVQGDCRSSSGLNTGHDKATHTSKVRNRGMSNKDIKSEEFLDIEKVTDLGDAYTVGDSFMNISKENSYRKVLEQQTNHPESEETGSYPVLDNTVSGNQSFILMHDPEGPWNYSTDQLLNIALEGTEWSALFYKVLGCPFPSPFVLGDNINETRKRYEFEFQQAIPDYPMLGRIWDTYIDVRYKQDEIEQLRNECVKVRAATSDQLALEGLSKLIYACDEALRLKLGLYIACD